MISTQIIQYLWQNKDAIGFAKNGGYVKQMLWSLAREGYNFTRQDACDSLNYLEQQGYLQTAGMFGSQQLYSMRKSKELK